MTIGASERRLTSILVTKICSPSKFARVVLAALMEKLILEDKYVTGFEFYVDDLSRVDHRIN